MRAFCTLAFLVNWLSVNAIWPFPPKRFTSNSLIGAGSLGLTPDGRVAAFGDLNGDQLCVANINRVESNPNRLASMDVLMIGSDQQTLTPFLWNHGKLPQSCLSHN